MVNVVKKEDIQEQVSGIKMVNVNSISFNSNHSAILPKLKTSSKQAAMMVPYKVDTGCNGNIMPFHIFKKYFLTPQKIDWQQQKIQLHVEHITAQLLHNWGDVVC